jgi:hypothetical protein
MPILLKNFIFMSIIWFSCLDVELLNAVANNSPHVIKFLTVMTLCNTVIPIKRFDIHPPDSLAHIFCSFFLIFILDQMIWLPVLLDQFCIKPSPRMRMPWLMQLQICIWFLSARMETMQVGFLVPKFVCFVLYGLLDK